jgi:hypothetical protein
MRQDGSQIGSSASLESIRLRRRSKKRRDTESLRAPMFPNVIGRTMLGCSVLIPPVNHTRTRIATGRRLSRRLLRQSKNSRKSAKPRVPASAFGCGIEPRRRPARPERSAAIAGSGLGPAKWIPRSHRAQASHPVLARAQEHREKPFRLNRPIGRSSINRDYRMFTYGKAKLASDGNRWRA